MKPLSVLDLRDQLNKLIENGHSSIWVMVPVKEDSGQYGFIPLTGISVGDPGGWGNEVVTLTPVKELKEKGK